VRREEAILYVEERRLGLLGSAARDQRQVGGLLSVAGEQHSPAGIGHAHDVVMPAMHVQRMRGQCARADVEDHRQALARDDVEDFLHQDESLAGGEIRHAPAGQRKPFARRSRAVLGLRLEEL
jgi:hypothetical protein